MQMQLKQIHREHKAYLNKVNHDQPSPKNQAIKLPIVNLSGMIE